MFLVVSLFVTVSIAPAIRAPVVAPVVAVLLAGLTLVIPVAFVAWFNENTPIGEYLLSSFQSISGLSTSRDLLQHCTSEPVFGLILTVVLSILMLPVGIVGGLATIAVPVGVIATLFGILISVIKRSKAPVIWGTSVLALGMAGVVVAGLSLRLIHFASGLHCVAP